MNRFSNEWDAYRQNQERTRQFAARELEVRNRLQEELRIQQALELQQREQMHQQLVRMQELQARQSVAEQALGISTAPQTSEVPSTSTTAPAVVTTPIPVSSSTSAATTPASNSRFHEGFRPNQTPVNHSWTEPADLMDSLSVSEMESLDETDGESVYSPEEREERDAIREQQSNIVAFEQQSTASRAWHHAMRQEGYSRMSNSNSNNAESPASGGPRVGSRMERNRRIREQAESLRRGHTEAYREARDEAIRAANYQTLVNETLLRARPPTAIVTPIRNLDHNERPENLKDEDLKIMVDCKVCYGQVADMCMFTLCGFHTLHSSAPSSAIPVCLSCYAH